MAITSRIHKMLSVLLIIALISSVFYGCTVDGYAGKRPNDCPSSTWVCRDPDILFSIGEHDEVFCEVNGQPLPDNMTLGFGFGVKFWIHDNSTGMTVFEGSSTYSPTKMYVIVTNDELFDGVYKGKKILFERIS